MTIEEKVREIIFRQDIAAAYDKNGHARQERVEKFTQSILALIKPMSDPGVIKADEATLAFFRKYLEMPNGTLEDLCNEIIGLKKIKPMSQRRLANIIDKWWHNQSAQRKLEVILAEWAKE